MVLAGIVLLAAAHALSANVPFQYGSAVVMGEAIALCLVVLYLIRRAGGGFKSKFAAAGLYTLLVLRKGGTIVRKTLLDHWELAFVYMLVVAAAACWVVGASRKTKNFHETVRVATKWTLRCVAVSLLHNAFKAPAAQFVVYAVLVALYARTRVLKMTGKKGYYREEKTE